MCWTPPTPTHRRPGRRGGRDTGDAPSAIEARAATVAALEGVNLSAVAADALTASASGLDPHISPEYALLQVPRVAAERGLDETDVEALVEENTQGPDLGYLGEQRVDVLQLNIALAALET